MTLRVSYWVMILLLSVNTVSSPSGLFAAPPKRVIFVAHAYDNRENDLVKVAGFLFVDAVRDLSRQFTRLRWEPRVWASTPDPKLPLQPDEAPTEANIRGFLKSLSAMRSEEEVLVILIGHIVSLDSQERPKGRMARIFFCPENAMYQKLKTINQVKSEHRLLALEEIYGCLKACPAQKKLLVLVTALSASYWPEKYEPPLCARLPELPLPPNGLALVTSCAPGEFSTDNANFLDAFREGLAGLKADGISHENQRDGAVTVEEAIAYAQARVKKTASNFGKWSFSQHPTVYGRLPRDWVLAGTAPASRWKLLKSPFVTKDAQQRQAEVAQLLNLKEPVVANALGMKLVVIPSGEFRLGSDSGYDDERPRPRIALSRPYFLGQHEVTQKQYRAVMGDNPSAFSKVPELDTDAFPVEQVTFKQAVLFCNALSEREKLTPYYRLIQPTKDEKTGRVLDFADYAPVGGQGYRLPTEAEWEWACRAGTETPYSVGDKLDGTQANVDAGRPGGVKPGTYLGQPTRVGSFAPNAWGLYDMHGNVAERVEESYDPRRYKELAATLTDGSGGIGYGGLARGGAWNFPPRDCTSSVRVAISPDTALKWVGLRVARDAE